MKFSVHLTLAALAGRGLQLAGAAAVEDAAASSAAKCVCDPRIILDNRHLADE